MKVAALIPAAGASRRLGRPKQLVEFEAAGCDAVYVVTGYRAENIAAVLRDERCELVEHRRWEEGMGSSLAAGSMAIPETYDAILVLPCDLPRLPASHLTALCEAAAPIAATAFEDGNHGAPACFTGSAVRLLSRLSGDRGAQTLLRSREVPAVPCRDAELDLDTEEDLGGML